MQAWHHGCVRDHPNPDLADVEMTQVMHALSDPVRLQIVRALAAEEMHCAQIAIAIDADLGKSTLSHHYAALREAGITTARYEGQRKHLSLRRAELDQRFPGLLDAVLRGASLPA